MNTESYWESESSGELFFKLIGDDFGPISAESAKAIRLEKEIEATRILDRLQILPFHRGLEIGSGCGFLTKIAAQKTSHITAVDISDSFLAFARNHCRSQSNIDFRKIESGDLSFISDDSIHYCFAYNVFIHLNFFEIVRYLEEIYRVLLPEGKFWFDVVEVERVKISDTIFRNSLLSTAKIRNNRGCLYFNSAQAIENAATALKFRIHKIHRGENCNTSFLLEKC